MSFLLDTDVCSAFLKGDRRVYGRFMQHAGQLHVSAICAAELYTWTSRSKAPADRRRALTSFLGDVIVLAFDSAAAQKFGELRAAQLDTGALTPQLDLMIAATALTHDLTLVTHNTIDYATIATLRLQDWLN